MARNALDIGFHTRSYLKNELESLGLQNVKLNEFNDGRELGALVSLIKQSLLNEYRDCYPQSETA